MAKTFLTNDFKNFEIVNYSNLNKGYNYIGLIEGDNQYCFDLNTGVFYSGLEELSIGKEINGYFVEFSNNEKLIKKPIYYCESVPVGMGEDIVPKNIYFGYEVDLTPLCINYGFYKLLSAKVVAVFNCNSKKVGLTINTIVEVKLNGNSLVINL